MSDYNNLNYRDVKIVAQKSFTASIVRKRLRISFCAEDILSNYLLFYVLRIMCLCLLLANHLFKTINGKLKKSYYK